MTSSETLSALVRMLEYSSENVTVATLSSLQHVQGSKQQLDAKLMEVGRLKCGKPAIDEYGYREVEVKKYGAFSASTSHDVTIK